jgi:hypothetical protein
MAQVRNISTGPRGVWLGGVLTMIDPGKTGETDEDDISTEWFEMVGGKASDDDAEPGPLDGSVDELTAHLEGVADPDEVQRLIDAETAGKSRKGALAALEARRDELLA